MGRDFFQFFTHHHPSLEPSPTFAPEGQVPSPHPQIPGCVPTFAVAVAGIASSHSSRLGTFRHSARWGSISVLVGSLTLFLAHSVGLINVRMFE